DRALPRARRRLLRGEGARAFALRIRTGARDRPPGFRPSERTANFYTRPNGAISALRRGAKAAAGGGHHRPATAWRKFARVLGRQLSLREMAHRRERVAARRAHLPTDAANHRRAFRRRPRAE